jgi:uncharacterized membrane protein YgcG
MKSNALRHIGIELYGEKSHKTSGGNMNKILDKKKELLAIIFVVALLGFTALFRSTSYAAVGDVVTSTEQREINGVTYPATGSKVTGTSAIRNATAILYNDGTIIIKGTGQILDYDTAAENPIGKFPNIANAKTVILGGAVTYTGSNILYHAPNIVNAYIEDSVTSVGTLLSIEKIENLRLGSGLTIIGGSAFAKSPLTGGLVIPDTVKEIRQNSFSGYTGTTLHLPNGLEVLDGFANTKITSVNIPNSVKEIGQYAFLNTDIESITIPNGVEIVGGFTGTKLKTINLPDSVTTLTYGAFDGTQLESLTGGLNVTYIGGNSFRGTKVHTIPFKEINYIGARAFDGIGGKLDINLDHLNRVGTNIADGIEFTKDLNLSGTIKIDNSSDTPFFGTTIKNVILKDVTVGSQAGGRYLFTNSKINTVTLLGNNYLQLGSAVINKLDLGECQLGDDYVKLAGADVKNLVWGNQTRLGNDALKDCKFDELTIPKSITSLGSYVFRTANIGKLKIDVTDMTLDKDAFYGLGVGDFQLTTTQLPDQMLRGNTIVNLIISDSLESIGKNVFSNSKITGEGLDLSNTKLSRIADSAFVDLTTNNIILPDTVKSIGSSAFAGVKIKNLNLTDNLTSLGNSAFQAANIEGNIYIGKGITAIDTYTFRYATIGSITMADTVTRLGDSAFASTTFKDSSSFNIGDTVTTIGNYAFQNTNLTEIIIPESVTKIGSQTFIGSKIESAIIPSSVTTLATDAFKGCTSLKTLITRQGVKFNTSVIAGCTSLTKLVILSDIEASASKSNIPSTTMIYCESGSTVETWCNNNTVAYKILTEDGLNELEFGRMPSLVQDSKMVDFDSMSDIVFNVDLGKKPAGASGIKKVMVDNKDLTKDVDYKFNGTKKIIITKKILKTLYNGTHSVSILFDNGTFKSGASIYVMSSTVPVIDPTKPPVALDTVKYEFYKDYPDYLIIPVSLNGATSVTKLKIGSEVVDPDEYYLDDGAIVISYDYLSTLDAGKYRILPTFDDPAITTLNNIQLWVYENAADRAAPYLLQTRIIFRGQSFGLRFDAGVGDLEASNVLALVIDNQMLLPDGRLLPLSSSNVSKVKKIVIDDIVASPSEATRKSEDIYTITPKEINTASPSEATNQTMSLMSSSMHVMSYQLDQVFYVVDNEIHVSGKAISSMKLAEGDHLMGAIFDNTENTSDVRKVILSIMSDKDNGTNTPGNNGTPGNNNGSNNGGNSSSGGNSGSGSHGSNSGGGGSGSGDSSDGPGAKGEDSKVKPVVRDDGGSYNVNPNDLKDVTYTDKDGNLTPNKWIGDSQNWRHTNKDSKLDYGWFLDIDGNWYLLTKETGKDFGTARYGWFHESQDGKWYYLSTKDNKMAKGKVKIDGKDYNFNATNQEPTYYGDNINGWIYDRTKGLPVGCWIEDI